MFVKKFAKWSSVLFLAALSSQAAASIVIENHTSYYGTAKMDFTPCSSISSSGVLKPYSRLEVSDAVVKSFCGIFDCSVNLYLSANCSGGRIGVVKVSPRKGITSIRSFANGKIRISGGGKYAVIDPA